MRHLVAIVLAATLLAGNAAATEKPRYGAWSPQPDPQQSFVDELRRLIDDADRLRAADPRFLRDLRALADRFDNPWPVNLVDEDFRGGGFRGDSNWHVVSGEFSADPSYGLRSTVTAPAYQSAPQREEKVSREELALRLFGQLLNKGDRNKRNQNTAPPAPPPLVPAQISLRQAVSNAFSLTATLHVEPAAGPLTLGLVQGPDAGYYIVTGDNNAIQLQRRGKSGGVALADAVYPLADGAAHRLTWTRASNGEMVVTLDDIELMRALDTGYRDNWKGVTLINGGGAITLRRLQIFGTR